MSILILPRSALNHRQGLLYASDYVTLAVAYGIRKLVRGYAGPAIRVRRSSDGAEADIGWDYKDVDITALLSHVGAGNGFVTKIYDQTGNGAHLSQASGSAQPAIVTSGSFLGKIVGNGSSTSMTSSSSIGSGSADQITIFGRLSITDSSPSTIAEFLDAQYVVAGKNGYSIYYDPRISGTTGYSVASSKGSGSNYNISAFNYSGLLNSIDTVTVVIPSGSSLVSKHLFSGGVEKTITGNNNHVADSFNFSSVIWNIGAYSGTSFYSYWGLESICMAEGDNRAVRVSVESAL